MWEHRLPACSFRQLAEKHSERRVAAHLVSSATCRRLQAGSLSSPEHENYARPRLGSISSATLDANPVFNRNIAANAIMAALSVHSHSSALLNAKPSLSQASINYPRTSCLHLTPP